MREAFLLLLVASSALIGVPQRTMSTEAYLALIVRYSWGEHAAVTGELAQWPLEALQPALRDLPVVLPIVSKRHDISEAALVATAMAVHVDVARRAGTNEEVDRYLALGQRLSDLLPVEETEGEVTRFRARWHHTAGTVLCGFSRPHDARGQFEIARKLGPGDSAILLALGSVHEIEGALLLNQRGSGAATAPQPANERDQSADERLAQAADLYEAALIAEPDLNEARLRLARTSHLRGRLDVAAASIDPVLQRADGVHLRYLARLIGGRISESLGRVDEALARYLEARTICRRCPSAALALSHAQLRNGDRDTARKLVDFVVTDTDWPPPADPWWTYQQGQWHAIDTILKRLREEVPE